MIISIYNQKGGCGKSTTAVNVGAALKALGHTVTGIDLDTQQHFLAHHGLLFEVVTGTTRTLKPLLNKIDSEFVIIDCPPALDKEAGAALKLAHLAIVPTPPRYLDTKSNVDLQQTVRAVRQRANIGLKVLTVITDIERAQIHRDIEAAVRKQLRNQVAAAVIPHSLQFQSASAEGISILQHRPKSAGAEAYRALTQEILKYGHQ